MEKILNEIRAYNVEKKILYSVNNIVDRLLRRSTEMQSVYSEIGAKLNEYQQAVLWDALLSTAAFWNPEASMALREDKRKLRKINGDIEKYTKKIICFNTGAP